MSTERAHAARLGMWVFLASEGLLFTVLFTVYADARARYAGVFQDEIHAHADKLLGSVNTAVLLVSSTLVAAGVHTQKEGHARKASVLVILTAVFGLCFLGIKSHEYLDHIGHGIVPGHGIFRMLYFTMTGLHALHVFAGVVALLMAARTKHVAVLENVALYWHLVDVIWIFLWPLFYLA